MGVKAGGTTGGAGAVGSFCCASQEAQLSDEPKSKQDVPPSADIQFIPLFPEKTTGVNVGGCTQTACGLFQVPAAFEVVGLA